MVEVAIGRRAGDGGGVAIAESAQVALVALALREAQHLAPVILVESQRAFPRRQAHGAGLEQLLKFQHSPESADQFVLHDVVQVTHGHEPLGGDRLLKGLDAVGDPRDVERRRRLLPDARQLGQAQVGRRRLPGRRIQLRFELAAKPARQDGGKVRVLDEVRT